MIFVTGASGTVGSQVVRELGSRGAAMRAGYHSEAKAQAARAQGLDAVAIDFERPETLGPAFRGVDTLYVVSASVAPEAGVVQAAKAAGVRRIVKQSVWGAAEAALSYGDIARILSTALERTITYVDVPAEAYKQGAMGAGMPEAYADALVDLCRVYSTGDAALISPNGQAITGLAPITFEQFAHDHAEALR